MKNRLALIAILLAAASVLPAATTVALHEGWQVQSACKMSGQGAEVSAAGFKTEGWIAATVPATVLTAQTAAGLIPDPYYGSNLRQIPGTGYPVGQNFSNLPMPADSPYRCGWWYRTSFKAPAEGRDQRQWLHFGGINYRAEIWLNGQKIADPSTVAGAYRIYDFDVTGVLKPGAENVLAVEVFAPGEKDLGINWVDWNPCPPDKDMGLWGAVELATTGPVTVRSPMVTTHFADEQLHTAELTVVAELHNAADHAVKGVVQGTAAGVHFERAVELAAHEDRTVAFTPADTAALKIHDPKPWWPWQMGEPHLENLVISFALDGHTTDEAKAEFGIREITSELTPNGSRLFRVNGKPILIRGAGWSQDMLLRTNQTRLENEFRLVRDMNLNTIRLEGKLETEDFFRLADRMGILVMAGWCCCDHWERWKEWAPGDLPIATASLRAQLLRLRVHPSLLVWLNGSDNAPPPDVERAYLDVEREVSWPNPVLSAASSNDTPVTGLNGVKMTGPYDYVAPSYWYVDKLNGGAYGFNTETSPGPAIPSLASRKKFLPDPEAWPPTANWSLHNGGTEFATTRVMDSAMEAVYAKPQSAADYERLAQTMAYDSERAMYEAYGRNKYQTTGVIQWMLNNAWPSMIWHLFDFNLEADSGYYATKKACEPLHLQYSYDDHTIELISSQYQRAEGLHAAVHVHGLNWNEIYAAETWASAAADSVQRVFAIPDAVFSGAERIFFVDLELKDAQGKILSRNFYWVPGTLTTFDWNRTDFTHTPAARHEDLSALTHLAPATVTASATISTNGKQRAVSVNLANSPAALAFQVNLAARTVDGNLIAPVLWQDNWIELEPGEQRTITALLPDDAPAAITVELAGWNIAPQKLTATEN